MAQLVKNPPAMWETWVGSLGWEEMNGYPFQYSGLENPTDSIVHGVEKSWTGLSDFHSGWFLGLSLSDEANATSIKKRKVCSL